MKDPKSDADPWEQPKRLEEWASKNCGSAWRHLLKLLFFGKY